MNQNQSQSQNQPQATSVCATVCKPLSKMNAKTVLITLGITGMVIAAGVGAACVYNTKQMRTARALKRTGKILFVLGTAMRNLSGLEDV